jgi:simple sugar transport system permease protein
MDPGYPPTRPPAYPPSVSAALALIAGLFVLVLFFLASGYDPVAALVAMWQGAFGSWYAFTSGTLVRAIPLILIGLGFALGLRAGVLNIGGEGQFYLGAMAATWVGLHVGSWPSLLAIPVALAAALAAGAAWVAGPAWLRSGFGVVEVISTLLLNFVAESLVSYMVQGPLQEAGGIYPQSDPVAMTARLPVLPGTRLHLGIVVAIGASLVLWYLFRCTWSGFALRATGIGPLAARIVGGIRVTRVATLVLLGSGALAGLAGGTEILGVSYALYPNLSPGYGFTAIAVALLARLSPAGIVPSAVLFGALEAGAGAMQRDAGIPAVAVYVAEAVIILAVLLASARSSVRPGVQASAGPRVGASVRPGVS